MNSEDHERHTIKAMIIGVVYFILLVVVALISINIVTGSYPDYSYIFEGVMTNIIIFGSATAFLAAFTAYFEKGEVYRMLSGIGKVALLAAYVYTFITGLDLSIEIEQVTAEIAVPGILLLIMGLMVLKAGYFPLEYYIYGIIEEKEREEDPFSW